MSTIPRTPEEHRAYWRGHFPAIPYGTCCCGCGQATRISKETNAGNCSVKGCPNRYVSSHASIPKGPDYLEEDRGYRTPCWIWRHGLAHGYATRSINNKRRAMHRVYYERYRGPIPEGLFLDHLCRIKACVNPDHLEAVTHAVNVQRGNTSKLDWPIVREIRRIHAFEGTSFPELARTYSVSRQMIRRIVRGTAWRE